MNYSSHDPKIAIRDKVKERSKDKFCGPSPTYSKDFGYEQIQRILQYTRFFKRNILDLGRAENVSYV